MFLLGSSFLAGCAGLLPQAKTTQDSPWKSFQDARDAYEKIAPYKTTRTELKELGFDPMASANVAVIDYTEILRRFYPSAAVPAGSIDRGVEECVAARENCRGFEVNIRNVQRKRNGNFFLDFLNFRRHTEITGWHFQAVILMKGDVVVYKLWNGQPAIHETEDSKNPLGPLQGIGERSLR
jgi:hypothetical protein